MSLDFLNNSYHLYNDCDVKYNILKTLHIIYLIVTQKYTNKISVSCYHCYLSLIVEGAKAQRAGELRRDENRIGAHVPTSKTSTQIGCKIQDRLVS